MILIAAGSETFESPGIADFWQPLVGDGAFALTRTMVVFGVTAVVLSIFLGSSQRTPQGRAG